MSRVGRSRKTRESYLVGITLLQLSIGSYLLSLTLLSARILIGEGSLVRDALTWAFLVAIPILLVWAFYVFLSKKLPSPETLSSVGIAIALFALAPAYILGINDVLGKEGAPSWAVAWAYVGFGLICLILLWYVTYILLKLRPKLASLFGVMASAADRLTWHRLARQLRISRLQRSYEWQFSARYWSLLHYWRKANLWLHRKYFDTTNWLVSTRSSAAIFLEIARVILWQIILAAVAVAFLLSIEHLVLAPTATFGDFGDFSYLDWNTYSTILTTLAQISAIFLGLYFTATSVVASTMYALVPTDVRSLQIREKVGSVYIRIVALLGAVAVLLLISNTLGFQPGILNLSLVGLLGLMSILSFFVLGMRALDFLDPTALTAYLARDFVKSVRSATPRRFQWQNPAFQQYHQRQGEGALDTYHSLILVAAGEPRLQGRPTAVMADRALGVWRVYATEKNLIPSDSYWFRRTYRHREWLTADYASVDMALRTGTGLQPEVVPDPMWVEKKITEIYGQAMKALIDQGNLKQAVDLASEVQRTLDYLGERFQVEEALHLYDKLGPTILDLARTSTYDPESIYPSNEQLGLVVGLLDLYALALISVLLGFSRRLRETSADTVVSATRELHRANNSALYTSDLPRPVVETLEHLAKALRFEHEVEGHTVSPEWYQQQLTTASFGSYLASAFQSLIAVLETSTAKEIETLFSMNRHLHVAQVCQRRLEACDKFRFHLREGQASFDRMASLRRVEDIPLPDIDWADLDRRVVTVREQVVTAMAKCSPLLAVLPHLDGLPDYFGQAYSLLANECYAAMAAGNDKLFQDIFPPFFATSLLAHDRLAQQLSTDDAMTYAVYKTEPIADLLELSGYAYVFSELDDKDYWTVAKREWDEYIAKKSDAGDLIGFLAGVIDYRQSIFAILPRDPLRTGWKIGLERILSERGLYKSRLSPDYVYGEPYARQHPSAVIRALAGTGNIWVSLQDVFLVGYLAKRPEAAGIKIPRLAQEFAESIDRELQWGISEKQVDE